MSLQMREKLLVVLLFFGYIFFGKFSETGTFPYIVYAFLWHIFFAGMILLFFQVQFEKRIWMAVLLILIKELVWNFSESFMSVLILIFRHVVERERNPVPGIWEGNGIFFIKSALGAVGSLFLLKWLDAMIKERQKEWYLLQTIPVLVLIAFLDLFNQGASNGILFQGRENYSLYQNQLFSHGAVCLLTLFFFCAVGGYLFGMERIDREQKKRKQYEWEVKGYQALEDQYRQMERLRHDMKNHVLSLQGLLKSREYEKMAHYLNQMAVFGAFEEEGVITGNKAVDALLYHKQRESQRKDIQWNCHVQIPKNSPVEEIDLCIILGNAIDNAIEECDRLQEPSERFIDIQVEMIDSFFLLRVKNRTRLREIRETYVSKKRNPGMQGIGLSNIRNTALKYNGVVELEIQDGIFSISVLLPPPLPDKRS